MAQGKIAWPGWASVSCHSYNKQIAALFGCSSFALNACAGAPPVVHGHQLTPWRKSASLTRDRFVTGGTGNAVTLGSQNAQKH
jgi:hypothetical protein